MREKETQVVVDHLFSCKGRDPFTFINLDHEARRYHEEVDASLDLLQPRNTQKVLDWVHKREGKAWSLGGWMEDRGYVWKGSYLDQGEKFVHLGVDLNVPSDTWVTSPCAGQILHIDTHNGTDIDWGTRVFFKPVGLDEDIVLLFAHLDEKTVVHHPGAMLSPRATVGRVGDIDVNGHVFPHLHLQAIKGEDYDRMKEERFHDLDGYGHREQRKELERKFPDPLLILAKKLNLGYKPVPTPVP